LPRNTLYPCLEIDFFTSIKYSSPDD
jgi:hypothetical protein